MRERGHGAPVRVVHAARRARRGGADGRRHDEARPERARGGAHGNEEEAASLTGGGATAQGGCGRRALTGGPAGRERGPG